MTQTTSRFFDELAKVMTNAAGAAQGLKREVDSVVRAQAERVLGELDVVQREEFEAVRDMAVKAREENERLEARMITLEAALAGMATSASPTKAKASAVKSPAAARTASLRASAAGTSKKKTVASAKSKSTRASKPRSPESEG